MKQKVEKVKKKETFDEVSGEDALSVYPSKFHIPAIPERRYLVTAKKIMGIALASICVNAMLGIGVFLWAKTGSNMRLSPKYIYWSELTDSFETMTTVQRNATCAANKASNFCKTVSNEIYYAMNFVREYHKARYTVSQDLADNARRWCKHTAHDWRIASAEAATKRGKQFSASDVYFGDFYGRNCTVSRYTQSDGDYDVFKKEQADRWQDRAATRHFKREVEIVNVEPFYSSRNHYITTMRVMESEGLGQLSPKVSYMRTMTIINFVGRVLRNKDGTGGQLAYFNGTAYLEMDNVPDGPNAGIRILSHAVLPNKTKLLRSHYEPLGY